MFSNVLRKFSSSTAQARTPLSDSLAYRVGVMEPNRIVDRIVNVQQRLKKLHGSVTEFQGSVTKLQGSVTELEGSVKTLNENVERVLWALTGHGCRLTGR